MPTSGKDVMEAIRVVARAALDGKRGVSYSELGKALGRPDKTAGRGLRPILEAATVRCRANCLPDIAPFVVLSSTLDDRVPQPSPDVFDETGYWKSSKIFQEDLEEAQRKVRAFAWEGEKDLQL